MRRSSRPEFHLVTPEKVAAAHAAGLQVVPWTANTPADWDKLIAAKVDAIISDDPAALIAYLKKRSHPVSLTARARRTVRAC